MKLLLGGGCYWCIEAVLQQLAGVTDIVSGHYNKIEAVSFSYDDNIIALPVLLQIFFCLHNPTLIASDSDSAYRSIIVTFDHNDHAVACQLHKALEEAEVFETAIQTRVYITTCELFSQLFVPVEEKYQNYYKKYPQSPFCTSIIDPKIAKLRKEFFSQIR